MTAFTLFVTGKRTNSTVPDTIKQFEEAGFVVQTTEAVRMPDLDSPVEDQDRVGAVAQQTIDAMKSAAVVVVINGFDWGRSMIEERGIAVALDKPVIVVDFGAYRPSTPLDFHPRVRPFRSQTAAEAIVRVAALRDGTPQPPQSDMFLPSPISAEIILLDEE